MMCEVSQCAPKLQSKSINRSVVVNHLLEVFINRAFLLAMFFEEK